MSNNIYQDIVEFIVAKVTGAVLGTNLEAGGFKQDSPDICSTIFMPGGSPVMLSSGEPVVWEDMQLRILSRGADYIEAMNEALKYYNVLVQMSAYGFPISAPVWRLSCEAVARPAKIEEDDRGLNVFTANYILKIVVI